MEPCPEFQPLRPNACMSGSKIGSVVHYIRNQHKQHHKMSLMSFDDEFIVLLKKHGVRFRPNYVFG
jgi:hypothetical protein